VYVARQQNSVAVKGKLSSCNNETGYGPSPSTTRRRDIPPKENNLQEFGD